MAWRLSEHPILALPERSEVKFTWQGRALSAKLGETLAAALLVHGERAFGRHPKDGSPQGLFCANGQCAQCLVMADGRPVKACMTPVTPGLSVEPMNGLPTLPADGRVPAFADIERIEYPVLIIGGGPAGLSAAQQLGQRGIQTLLIDDKDRLGGKLLLQTHRFFGSIEAVYAGTRGIDIAALLTREVSAHNSVEVWLNTTALAVYSDGLVGVLRGGNRYVPVKPRVLLVATGAREKSLAFRGNTLPGVYGAGAFQTLLNRDLIRPAERLFIVGGGNVGLITGYHALQAGITVVGLVEVLPDCGGYQVHRDKLVRLGVPIYTSHTILSANGSERVESVTIAQVDTGFKAIPGTERSFACDTVLVAVGLDPVDEFIHKARDYGLTVLAAGDADEIAEASAAIFAGKIAGLEAAGLLGRGVEVPPDWVRNAELLRSPPGSTHYGALSNRRTGVFPVLHCHQEIPCNPCASVCPQRLIYIAPDDIRQVPVYLGDGVAAACLGCEKCVRICPGLAITMVDYRQDQTAPTVTIPFEFGRARLRPGDRVTVLDTGGEVLGNVEVTGVKTARSFDHTVLVKVKAPPEIAARIAGIRVQEPRFSDPLPECQERLEHDAIVCRCERVTAEECRALIRARYRDVNAIKAVTRVGMGACGAKTCASMLARLFRDEGVAETAVTPGVRRPLFVEVPLGVFAGTHEG
jgi:NADPH-dependent 2,4-dienoyl-CoA reductase/sulfur reductase-like enzyme/ferredoxin